MLCVLLNVLCVFICVLDLVHNCWMCSCFGIMVSIVMCALLLFVMFSVCVIVFLFYYRCAPSYFCCVCVLLFFVLMVCVGVGLKPV